MTLEMRAPSHGSPSFPVHAKQGMSGYKMSPKKVTANYFRDNVEFQGLAAERWSHQTVIII